MSLQSGTATGGLSNQVVAMFETYDQASAARDALVTAGIDRARIELLDRSAKAEDASFPYERNEAGIWGALSGMSMPNDDSHVYAEGLHRGHAMLIVRAAPGEQDHIISLLDTQNPLDVDTQAAQWRQSGWSGTYAGAQSRVALIGFRGDGGTSHDQSRDEGAKESFASAPGVMHELEKAKIQRQLLLRDAAVRPQPGA